MADLTYYNDQELPVATFDWSNAGEDFSTGWTFTVRLARTTARATTVLLKTTGITSTATSVTVAWSTTDWSGLEAATTGTSYFVYLYARRTADSKDIEFRPGQPVTLTLYAAPGTSAVSPSSYPITVTAASVTVADTGGYYTGTNVETVLAEMGAAALLYKPAGLRRWRAALGSALDSKVGIMCWGDSITLGVGADNIGVSTTPAASIVDQKSYPAQLRRLFAQQYGDPGIGVIHRNSDLITLGSGVTASTTVGVQGSLVLDNTETITVSFTGTTFSIINWTNNSAPTTGNYKYNVDGTGDVAVTPGTAADTYVTTTITGLSDAAHSIVITGTTANQVFISGLIASRLSAGVQVHRVGVAGFTAYQLNIKDQSAVAARQEATRRAVTVTVPQALTIVCVGHNDWSQQNNATYSTPSPTEFKAELQSIITTATGGGSCVLLLSPPRPPASQTVASGTEVYTVDEYWTAARQLCDENDHVSHLRIADFWGSQATAEGLGLSITSSVHPTAKGYGDIARMLYRVLTSNIPTA